MTKTGSDIVDLLKQRQTELREELDRVSVALKALGAPQQRASTAAAPTAASASSTAAPKRKAGRPAASVGGKTVLDRIEAAIASAGRPLRVKEISKLVGAPYSTLAATLRRGRNAKRLTNPSFGAWSLPRLAGAATTTTTTTAAAAPSGKVGKKRGKYKPRKKKAKAVAKKAAAAPGKKKAKKRGGKKAKKKAAAAVAPAAAPVAAPAAPPA
ncbi:MAG: hypothetical protein Q8O67_11285 [Deltaproteobacteria bacterium]|nr:hypothetical protein [Deltaproteobacteria bacterium]